MNSQQENLALATVSPDSAVKASSSAIPGAITDTLRRAMEQGHLVSPANSCPNLPAGCEVAVSTVLIDVPRETYDVQGGKALTKTALNRIAKAVGVGWDDRRSHRTDNGDNPNFASYKAVGHFRDFDGTWRTIEAEKQMDLTEGSERAKTMKAGELSEARKFIAEHAQTKAQLRAIRSLGIRSSYTAAELEKPFVCARLIFTGQSDDPETRRVFAEATAKAMLGGSEMLFGTAETTRPMLTEASERSPESTTTAQPAQEPTPEVKTCDPEHCFGHGSNHVKACSLPVNAAAPAQQAASDGAWVIPGKGPARGLRITDPKVTPDTLLALLKEYADALNPEGDLRDKLNDDAVDFYSSALREVQKECDRREIKYDGSEKKY